MTGIGAFFGKMFGTEKAVNTIIDQGAKALDVLYYTKEERAQDQAQENREVRTTIAQDATEVRSMVVNWMKNTEGQNLARRFISIVVTGTWATEHLAGMLFSSLAVWVQASDKWIQTSKVISDYADKTTGAMMLVLGFYFAAPHLGAIVTGAMDRFSGKNKNT